MSKKLELCWDRADWDSCAIPLFDVIPGSTVITVTPKGVKRIRCRYPRYLVTLYPLSHRMLKAVGDAAEMARKENVYMSILLTKGNGQIGFLACTQE